MATNNSQLAPNVWVEHCADPLFSYAYFRVQDKNLAEELVQETFLSALVAREKFKGNSSEKKRGFSPS